MMDISLRAVLDEIQRQLQLHRQELDQLEKYRIKKDWIIELPGLNGGPSGMYRMSDIINALRFSIRDLEDAVARPHNTLDRLKTDVELLKKCVLNQPSDHEPRPPIFPADWIS
jgi:hypothetical protein